MHATTLTTKALYPSSLQWFEASSCKPTPRGQTLINGKVAYDFQSFGASYSRHTAIKKLRFRVGRVVRGIERQLVDQPEPIRAAFSDALAMASRLLNQKRHTKNKLYSIHAPETECISKGKAHKRYEFCVKASFAIPTTPVTLSVQEVTQVTLMVVTHCMTNYSK